MGLFYRWFYRARFIDLTGRRFGKLTVIEKAGRQRKEILWKCKCDCGTIKNIAGNNLRAGYIVSCGCSIKETLQKYKEKNLIDGTQLDKINNMSKIQSNNTSGVRGVYFSNSRKK